MEEDRKRRSLSASPLSAFSFVFLWLTQDDAISQGQWLELGREAAFGGERRADFGPGFGARMFKADLVRLKDSAAFKADPATYPQFNHLLYSADVPLPVVNLQQKDYWAPNGNTTPGKIARLYLPIHILAGWFFTTLFVVGVTGLIRRD